MTRNLFSHWTIKINMPNGYVSWSDIHRIYDLDNELKGNLRKASKLSYQAFQPENKKSKCFACNFINSRNHNCCCPRVISRSKGYCTIFIYDSRLINNIQFQTTMFSKPSWKCHFAEWWKNQLLSSPCILGSSIFSVTCFHVHCANIIGIDKHFARNPHRRAPGRWPSIMWWRVGCKVTQLSVDFLSTAKWVACDF